MITASNLSKFYGKFPALENFSFTISENGVVALLGLNGAGKTTTIRILTGFLIPGGGSVTIDGISLFENPRQAKKKIGYLPENPPLYEDLTVYEYLEFVHRIKQYPEEKKEFDIDDACRKTGLLSMKDRVIGTLSLGYRKRTGIAQAILGSPPLVIMDEPVSGLDPKQIIEIRNLLKELGKFSTVIISSHILSEVYKTCDRFILIKDGRLIRQFSHEELESMMKKISGIQIGLCGDLREKIEQCLGQVCQPVFLKEDESSFYYRLPLEDSRENRNRVIDLIRSSGLDLVQITKPEVTLEDIFMEMTR